MSSKLGHVIVSGRWDNNVAIVDVAKALDPANDCTPAAIISKPRVTPDIDTDGDGKVDAIASGQPVAVIVDPALQDAAASDGKGNRGDHIGVEDTAGVLVADKGNTVFVITIDHDAGGYKADRSRF